MDIYRYFNWSDTDARKILSEREMYFCNAKKWKNFGEFDFNFALLNYKELKSEIEINVIRMRKDDHLQYERWFNLHLRMYKIDFSKYLVLGESERDLLQAQVEDELISRRATEIINNRTLYERAMRQFYFKRTGIFSTSSVLNSKQLWEWKGRFNGHSNNNAVCIGLDSEILKARLDVAGNYSFGEVKYNGLRNQVSFVGSSADFLTNRLNSIAYTLPINTVPNIEQQSEVRILKFLPGNTSDKSTDRFLKLPDEAITRIIIDQNASSATKENILDIAEKIGCVNVTSFDPTSL